jgi:hypothetical protein
VIRQDVGVRCRSVVDEVDEEVVEGRAAGLDRMAGSQGRPPCRLAASLEGGRVERAEHVSDRCATAVIEDEGVLGFEGRVGGGVELAEEARVVDEVGGVVARRARAQADLVERVEIIELVAADVRGQCPVQVGGRFSRNALMPSRASSVAAFFVIVAVARS